MANEFKIVISAVDRATASVRRINDSISRITRPVADVQRSVAGLGREIGLGKMTASFNMVASSANRVANSVRSIAAPIAGVVGLGSLAGVAAMATEWGRMGMEVTNTSRNLGIATTTLQTLRGAAQMAGVSSDTLTSGMMSLGDTINDAKWGRNQGAVALMSRLGIGFRMTQDGSVDTVRSLDDVAAAFGKIKNVQTQHYVARQLGIEGLMPLLRLGGAGIDAYKKKYASLGGVQSDASIESAQRFGLQLNYLKAATDGLKFSIADRLVPVLSPLLEQMTNWIAKNRELISSKVADFAKGIASWVSKINFNDVLKGVTDTAKAIGKAVDAFGGWKNVIGAVVGLNIASSVAPLVSLGLALGGVGAGLAGLAAGTGGLAILAAIAAYAGYKGAEFIFGKPTKSAVPSRPGQEPAMHLRTHADLYETANKQRIVAGLPPLPPRQMMSRSQLEKEARQQRIQDLGLPRNLTAGVRLPSIYAGTAQAPLGIRSNNPLNIQGTGGETVFPTMEMGISAAYKDLFNKIGRGINTPAALVNAWSPAGAPGNSAAANENYAKSVERAVGTGPIDRDNAPTMALLISAMARFENGSNYDKPKLDEAVQRVVVEFKNAPPGTTATTRTNSDAPTPVRVATSMPLTGAP